MDDERLLDGDCDLENLLLRRVLPDLPLDLQERVLGHVHRELRREQWWSRASFAAGLAAAALLWINLSSSASLATVLPVRIGDRLESSYITAARIQELLPEASAGEAARHAVVLRAGARIPQCPRPAAGLTAWKLAEGL
jgi:hypothetical protein